MRSNVSIEPGKIQFFSLPKLVLFSLISIALLFFLFPKNEIVTNINRSSSLDNVSLNYLNDQLIALTGKGLGIKFTSKKMSPETKSKLYKHMLSILSQQAKTEREWKARWIAYQVLGAIVFSYKPGQESRQVGEETLVKMIKPISLGPYDTIQLEKVAKDALALENPKLAYQIYQQIIKKHPKQRPTFFANMALIANQSGNHSAAGNMFLKALKGTAELPLKKKYFKSSLKNYIAGRDYKGVKTALITYGPLFKKDKEMLLLMSKSALSSGFPKLAQDYVDLLLKLKNDGVNSSKTSEHE